MPCRTVAIEVTEIGFRDEADPGQQHEAGAVTVGIPGEQPRISLPGVALQSRLP